MEVKGIEINQEYLFDGENGLKFTNKLYKNELDDYKRKFSHIQKVIIHCTATDNEKWEDSDLNGVDDPLTLINFDINPGGGNPALPRRGCPFSTYHFLVTKCGNIFDLVSLNYWTMNTKGHNIDSVAISLNKAGDTECTPEQYDALVNCICYVFDLLDWNFSRISVEESLFFHRDFNKGKTCPGILDKTKLINDVIERLKTWGDNV